MQHLQVAERGIAGAEIVDRHAHAQLAQLRDETRILLEVMQCGGFGQLHDQARRHVLLLAHIVHKALQPGRIGCGGARNIDCQGDGGMGLEFAHRGFQREAVHQMHDAHLLAGRHEQARRLDRAIGPHQAQQAFVMRHLARAGRHDGLIGEFQAVVLQGLHHFVGNLHQAQARGLALGRGFIHGKAVAAAGARLVQRLFGAQHGLLAVGGGLGQPHRAHAAGHLGHAGAGFDAAAAHRGAQARRHHRDFILAAIFQDDAELVAGGTADDVAAAQGTGQTVAGAHDHFVAGIETETVIDHGQAVDRGHQEGAVAVFRLGRFNGA